MEKIHNVVLENDERLMELVREFLKNNNFEIMIVTTASRQKVLLDTLQHGVMTQMQSMDFGRVGTAGD